MGIMADSRLNIGDMVDLPAVNMKFGIVVVRSFEEHIEKHLMPLVEGFAALGVDPNNVEIRTVPTLHDVVIATHFFAQYTDVDGVVILAPENRVMGTLSVMNGIVQLEMHWNMVVQIGGSERATDIVEMIAMQNEMEANAPDRQDRSNLS